MLVHAESALCAGADAVVQPGGWWGQVEVLHLSDAEAYLRITVARASRRFPLILAMIGDGRLHLSGIAKLAPRLTEENAESLLGRAVHRSKREIEELVAEVAPRSDVPERTRKLPTPSARDRAEVDPADESPSGSGEELRPDGAARPIPTIGTRDPPVCPRYRLSGRFRQDRGRLTTATLTPARHWWRWGWAGPGVMVMRDGT
jgi:hypothetical protein